jgi:hypothetical protein
MNLKRTMCPARRLKVHVKEISCYYSFPEARVLFLNFFAPIKLHYASEPRKVALIRLSSFCARAWAPRCECVLAGPLWFSLLFRLARFSFLISSETLKHAQSRKLLWREKERGCFPAVDPREHCEESRRRSVLINRRQENVRDAQLLFLLNKFSLERSERDGFNYLIAFVADSCGA